MGGVINQDPRDRETGVERGEGLLRHHKTHSELPGEEVASQKPRNRQRLSGRR